MLNVIIGRLWVGARDPWSWSFRWNGPYNPKALFSRRNFLWTLHIGPISVLWRRKEVDEYLRGNK